MFIILGSLPSAKESGHQKTINFNRKEPPPLSISEKTTGQVSAPHEKSKGSKASIKLHYRGRGRHGCYVVSSAGLIAPLLTNHRITTVTQAR